MKCHQRASAGNGSEAAQLAMSRKERERRVRKRNGGQKRDGSFYFSRFHCGVWGIIQRALRPHPPRLSSRHLEYFKATTHGPRTRARHPTQNRSTTCSSIVRRSTENRRIRRFGPSVENLSGSGACPITPDAPALVRQGANDEAGAGAGRCDPGASINSTAHPHSGSDKYCFKSLAPLHLRWVQWIYPQCASPLHHEYE